MSRLKFARSMGAEPHNPYNAWSYINHEERFVLFGVWADGEVNDRQHIFSSTWKENAKGKKPASYAPSLRHLEYILEEGYELRTFRQYSKDDDGSGIPKIKSFDATYESRSLVVAGENFFAVEHKEAVAHKEQLEPVGYEEGAKLSVTQTQYERSPIARAKCLELFGAICSVCSFDFGKQFGKLGQGFIHVHHLIPVSKRGNVYKVDPQTDLRPVCPNCHAMIHKRNPPFSIDEMREIRALEVAKK